MVDRPDPNDEDAYDFGDGLDQPEPMLGDDAPDAGGGSDFDDFDDMGNDGAGMDLDSGVLDQLGDTDDLAAFNEGERSGKKLAAIVGAVAIVLVGAAGAASFFLLGESEPLPIVHADAGPIKTPPSEEGGLQVPFQDALVLNRPEDEPEVLMRRPLEPLPSAVEAGAPTPPPDALPPLFGDAPAEITPLPPLDVATSGDDRETGVLTSGQPPTPIAQPDRPRAPQDLTRETSQPAGGEPAPIDLTRPTTPPEPIQTAARTPEPPKAAPKPAPKPAAAASSGGSGWKVQLASLRSRAAAQRGWTDFQGRAPDLLKSQPLTIQQAQVSGATYYRIKAGDFASKSGAAGLCQKLKSRGLDCVVTK